MAERSFKEEVEKLKLGDGEEFHGEGILAVTKALLQSGGTIMEGLRCVPINGHDMVGAYYAVHRRQQPPSGLEVQLLEVLWNQLNGWN